MNVFIIGCGRTGSELGKMLSMEGHDVVLIDINREAFRKLGSSFNGLQVVGSGTDEILLREAKAQEVDVFVSLTDKDNVNIMAAQVATAIFHIPKVIAKVNDTSKEGAFQDQGFHIVSGTHLITEFIWNEISQKPYKRCYSILPDILIIRFTSAASMVGQTVSQLNVGGEFMVCGVIRHGKSQLAIPNLRIKSDDELVAVTKISYLGELEKRLET